MEVHHLRSNDDTIVGALSIKEHLEGRKINTPLEILEIGIGEGSNLPYYPDNSNLTVLDMNESFIEYLEKNRKKFPQVSYKKTVIGMAEDMHQLDDDSFDVVVCTYVLCSVKNVRYVLKGVKRVLEPLSMLRNLSYIFRMPDSKLLFIVVILCFDTIVNGFLIP
ncbi:Methyltransferase-like protein 7B [Araneus ventricosus]|uniref:Methyltransferase-like protein 7B n=1 Tax=Araneus ventricosus TaxID=182803 RepID=A0A4Y2A3M3_ARAVE|nr:Methyltransferase-like protein 7B [Araneus ventricosus]